MTEEEMPAYAGCLREQGIDIGDPVVDEDGNVSFAAVDHRDPELMENVGTAMEVCGQPPGGLGRNRPNVTELEDTLLEYAQCTRENGYEDLPDPDISHVMDDPKAAGRSARSTWTRPSSWQPTRCARTSWPPSARAPGPAGRVDGGSGHDPGPRTPSRPGRPPAPPFTSLFLGLGVVALLVGGVGIANVMVIPVLECRREIGLGRALGATRRHITVQFVAEALLLALLGGIAGAALGGLVTAGYDLVRGWAIVVPPVALGGGVAAALVIGAVAGLYPARRAAPCHPPKPCGPSTPVGR